MQKMKKIRNILEWEQYTRSLSSQWLTLKGPLPKKFPVIAASTIESHGPDNQTVTHEYLYSEDVLDMQDPPTPGEIATKAILDHLSKEYSDVYRYEKFINEKIDKAVIDAVEAVISLNSSRD